MLELEACEKLSRPIPSFVNKAREFQKEALPHPRSRSKSTLESGARSQSPWLPAHWAPGVPIIIHWQCESLSMCICPSALMGLWAPHAAYSTLVFGSLISPLIGSFFRIIVLKQCLVNSPLPSHFQLLMKMR